MFISEIGMYLKKIHNQLERRRNKNLREYGLTGTQLEVLEYMGSQNEENCILAGIAEFFDVKHTSALHVVKVLEKKGLAGREEKQCGSRCGKICLTREGQKVMQKIDKGKSEIDKIMLRDMTQEEQQTLHRLLQKIYQNLRQEEMQMRRESALDGKGENNSNER